MPAIVWLPARPSPTDAPTAPPPSASPAPTMAPANFTASAIEVSAIGTSPLWGLSLRSGVDDFAGLFVGLVRGHGGVEVQDGEQREDEGLDGSDPHVEQLPDHSERHGQDGTDGSRTEFPDDQRG